MGLRKLTDSKNKVKELLSKSKITQEDVNTLDEDGHKIFGKRLNEMVNELKDKERDAFLHKIDEIINSETRNSLWEYNHVQIINHISESVRNFSRMPTKAELSKSTGLSRQTIDKHFKEFRKHPLFIEHMEQYQFMTQKVMAIMLNLAMKGDVKAGRLFVEMIGGVFRPVPNQKNYIQINNMVLTQEEFSKLNANQISKIEEVLREASLIQKT